MLSLVSGHYPAGPGQVAVTSGLASDLRPAASAASGTRAADAAGRRHRRRTRRTCWTSSPWWRPGQVSRADPGHRPVRRARREPRTPSARTSRPLGARCRSNALNPETHLARRWPRSGCCSSPWSRWAASPCWRSAGCARSGMLGSLGRHGPARPAGRPGQRRRRRRRRRGGRGRARPGRPGWPTGRGSRRAPTTSSALFSLPWLVIGLAMVLAVVATFVAASRPARAIARIPVVAALSGRPAPPKQVRRSAVPGLVLLVAAFVLLGHLAGQRPAAPRASARAHPGPRRPDRGR